MNHSTGWVRDLPDHRDSIFNLKASIKRDFELPSEGGLLPDELPAIWNQSTIGSCTAHGSLRGFCAEAMQQGVTLPTAPAGGAPLSRLEQYWDSRDLEGTTSTDSGAQVRDAIKALHQFGCAPETLWPYDVSKFADQPPANVQEAAKLNMAFQYHSIILGPGAPMRTALVAKKAIVFGFVVPDYFEDPSVWDPASGQPLPLPTQNTQYIGGHCVAATYYDFGVRVPYFTCDNSWGPEWGMNGRFNIDARWFGYGLATDLWVFDKVS